MAKKKSFVDEDGKEYVVKEKKPFYKKWWFWVFIAPILFPTLLGMVVSIFNPSSANSGRGSEETEQVVVEEIELNNEALAAIDGTNEQINAIEEILASVGVAEIKEATYDDMLEGVFTHTDEGGYGTEDGYRLKTKDFNVIIYVQDGELIGAKYADNKLYDHGEILGQITDYGIDSAEFVRRTSQAEEYVKSYLKSPSTAEFPGRVWQQEEWSVYKMDGKVYIESYVDAQNSFGAVIRSYFTIEADGDTVTQFIFDGEQVIP